MAMNREALAADLKTSLRDASASFNAVANADFLRMIDIAAGDMHQVRPLVRFAGFNFDSDAVEPGAYPVPADFVDFHSPIWGFNSPLPIWDPAYVSGDLRAKVRRTSAGQVLYFNPAPSMAQISTYGRRYTYHYFARHQVGSTDADTTIAIADRPLLILRAQAEACRELAFRGITKPVALRDGQSQAPANSTPQAMWQALMQEFKAAVR